MLLIVLNDKNDKNPLTSAVLIDERNPYRHMRFDRARRQVFRKLVSVLMSRDSGKRMRGFILDNVNLLDSADPLSLK